MADKLHFSLVSPAREVFSGEVDHVIAPGSEGQFGVLPNHAPFMATLKRGVVTVMRSGAPDMHVFVRGGFADVTPEGFTILAEEAIPTDDLDPAEIDREIEALRLKIAEHGKAEADAEALRLHQRMETLEAMKAAAN